MPVTKASKCLSIDVRRAAAHALRRCPADLQPRRADSLAARAVTEEEGRTRQHMVGSAPLTTVCWTWCIYDGVGCGSKASERSYIYT